MNVRPKKSDYSLDTKNEKDLCGQAHSRHIFDKSKQDGHQSHVDSLRCCLVDKKANHNSCFSFHFLEFYFLLIR